MMECPCRQQHLQARGQSGQARNPAEKMMAGGALKIVLTQALHQAQAKGDSLVTLDQLLLAVVADREVCPIFDSVGLTVENLGAAVVNSSELNSVCFLIEQVMISDDFFPFNVGLDLLCERFSQDNMHG